MTVEPGTRIGPCEVVALLGTGGMGEVICSYSPSQLLRYCHPIEFTAVSPYAELGNLLIILEKGGLSCYFFHVKKVKVW